MTIFLKFKLQFKYLWLVIPFIFHFYYIWVVKIIPTLSRRKGTLGLATCMIGRLLKKTYLLNSFKFGMLNQILLLSKHLSGNEILNNKRHFQICIIYTLGGSDLLHSNPMLMNSIAFQCHIICFT